MDENNVSNIININFSRTDRHIPMVFNCVEANRAGKGFPGRNSYVLEGFYCGKANKAGTNSSAWNGCIPKVFS